MTWAACIMGWPAKHSNSPLIHRYWLDAYGIAGDYRIEEVPPEAFPAFLADLSAHGYVGGNVTLPHKLAALTHSEPDEHARAVGAANTVWFEEGVLRSTNTDGEGFFANLDAEAPGWDRDLSRTLVVGAGGAARAIVHGLRARGAERIDVVNRSAERAESLREAFGRSVRPAGFEAFEARLDSTRLVVNTTSLGMAGGPDWEWDLAAAPSDTVVADIVYVPLRTGLLMAAEARGLRTVDGLGMLLHQAVNGFERWFGVRPAVTADQRHHILDVLARKDAAQKEPSR